MKFNIWNDYEYMDLPDVLSFIVDNRGKTVPTDDKGTHILIATNCIRNENLYPSYEKVRFLNEETYQNWFRAHPIPGDIIFVNKGTPGRVCLVPDPVDFCIAQDMMAFRVNPDIVYNKYLFAVLRSARIQNQISVTTVGDVIPHFKKQHLHEIKIPIPPMEIQKLIGDYYFMFCEKIVVNNKINRNLSEQLQAVFADRFLSISWDEELPEDWEVVKLKDVAQFSQGVQVPVEEQLDSPTDGYERFIRIVDITQGNEKDIRYIENRPRGHVTEDEIFMIRYGTPGILSWNYKGIIANNLFKITSSDERVSVNYLYSLLKTEKVLGYLRGNAVSSTMPAINFSTLNGIDIVIPDAVSMSDFTIYSEAIRHKQLELIKENMTLAHLRDELLPKLMSGAIDIENIEM